MDEVARVSSDLCGSVRPIVRNFRQAASLPCVYRCASTDGLADFDVPRSSRVDRESPEYILLYRAGLILDLRSPSERNEAKAATWMGAAPGGKIVAKEFASNPEGESSEISGFFSADGTDRIALRIDVLSPARLFHHLTENWLTPSQRDLSNIFSISSGEELDELRMRVLNDRGLPGLYEAIIKTSGTELSLALKSLTAYFEGSRTSMSDAAAVVHCVQGKDRTGIVIMLCQSIIGLNDEEIILDYSMSNEMRLGKKSGSAAADKVGSSTSSVRRGTLDWKIFSGAPREAMRETLAMIRADYGSISPGFLDAIDFEENWRCRFISAVVGSMGHDYTSSRL